MKAKVLMVLLAMVIMVSGTIKVFAAESAIVESDWEWTLKTEIAVWYNVNDFDPDSLFLFKIGRYSGLFDLPIDVSVGLRNFEQVETSGDQWYHDIEPVVGVSMDAKPLLELLPVLGQWIEKIPNAVSFGIGITAEIEQLDDLEDIHLGVWVGIAL